MFFHYDAAGSSALLVPQGVGEQTMTAKQNAPVPIVLRRRVIIEDGLVFDAEREVTVPIQPFVGLVFYNILRTPPGCDDSEERVEEVAYDLKTGQVICYLDIDDYRPESSGCDDWTEAEVRDYYGDWTLKRDETCRPTGDRNGN
jgi:hypothetical protein